MVDYNYRFSFSDLLSMISTSYSLRTIIIMWRGWNRSGEHAMHDEWKSNQDKLILMFNQHQFDIAYEVFDQDASGCVNGDPRYRNYEKNFRITIKRQ